MRTPSAPRSPAPAPGRSRAALRRAEAWLWTGPVGHLVGGALDFATALARYQLARARRPIRSRGSGVRARAGRRR